MNIYFYTQDQLELIFFGWQVDSEPLPREGKTVHVAFPGNGGRAEVTIAERKSTYGKRLYQVKIFSGDAKKL